MGYMMIGYFDFTSIINTIIFLITLIVLYDTPKKSIITLIGAFLLRFFI